MRTLLILPLVLLLGVVGFLLAPPAPAGAAGAAACTCMSPKRPPCEVWWQTGAIFVGRVTRVRTISEEDEQGDERRSRIVTLRVQERWRGLGREREVDVRTGAGGGDCGFDFRKSETYLVYANRSVHTGRLETGICSRTAHIDDAQRDLAYLEGLDEAEEVVSLYGMVYREREPVPPGEDPEAPLDPGGPLADVTVHIETDGVAVTTTTDAQGWYEVSGLRDGTYDVRLEGAGIGQEGRWRVHLPVAPACVWRNLVVEPLSDEGPP